ncbi:hypothetical protein Pcinc_029392 [Petrolisthes cinctipes]|uniref:Uncharacterized protein n=1 Tax=Petrolisthes cinctipes TaxID=88211 RepID=A0AAE1F063_PETCI|nr:hypothetical protein Pcinc_029392 [Petrolisthes cinctipes]
MLQLTAFLMVVVAAAVLAAPADPHHAPAYKSVEYVADHHGGYQANVNYKGKAQYPKEFGPAVTFKPSGGGYDPKPEPSYH